MISICMIVKLLLHKDNGTILTVESCGGSSHRRSYLASIQYNTALLMPLTIGYIANFIDPELHELDLAGWSK